MSRTTDRLRMVTTVQTLRGSPSSPCRVRPTVQTLRGSPTTPPPAYSPGGFRWPPVPSRLAGLQRHLGRAANRAHNPISLIIEDISGYPQTTVRETVSARSRTVDDYSSHRRAAGVARGPLQLHTTVEEVPVPMSEEEEALKRHLHVQTQATPTRALTQEEEDLKQHLGIQPKVKPRASIRRSKRREAASATPTADTRSEQPWKSLASSERPGTRADESTASASGADRARPSAAQEAFPRRTSSLRWRGGEDNDEQRKRHNSLRRNDLQHAPSERTRLIERKRRLREGRERVLAWREAAAIAPPRSPPLSRQSSRTSLAYAPTVASSGAEAPPSAMSRTASVTSLSMSRNPSVTSLSSWGGSTAPGRTNWRNPSAQVLSLNTQPQRLVTPGPIPGHSRDGSQSSQGSSLPSMEASSSEVMRPHIQCSYSTEPLVLSRRPSSSPHSRISSAASSSMVTSTISTGRSSPFSTPSKPSSDCLNKPLPAINDVDDHSRHRANGSVNPFPHSALEVQTSTDVKARQVKVRQRRRTISEDPSGCIHVRGRRGNGPQINSVLVASTTRPQSRSHSHHHSEQDDAQQDFEFDKSNGVKLQTRALPVWRRYLNDCFDIIDTKWKGVPLQL